MTTLSRSEAAPSDSEVVALYDDIDHEQWLSLRREGIGGSDAAAIMGLSAYASPLSLWMEKTGRDRSPDVSSEAAEMGTLLEPFIRRELVAPYLLEHYGMTVDVLDPVAMYRSTRYPFMMANTDGFLVHGDRCIGLEIKTGNSYQMRNWGGVDGDEIPDAYYCQVQHYMAALGLDLFYVFGVIGNNRLLRIVPRNDEFVSRLIDREAEFWAAVKQNDPLYAPLPIGLDCDFGALTALGSPQTDEPVDLVIMTPELERYETLKEEVDEREKERDQIKQLLMAAMGQHRFATARGFRITRVMATRTSIDTKRLRAEHPEIASQYERESSTDYPLVRRTA